MMSDPKLPPGMDGLLGQAQSGNNNIPEGKRKCSRCGEIRSLSMYPEQGPTHLCYECLGGNTQALNLPRVRAKDDVAVCPGCDGEIEVSPAVYGEMAQCTECETVFLIDPPGLD